MGGEKKTSIALSREGNQKGWKTRVLTEALIGNRLEGGHPPLIEDALTPCYSRGVPGSAGTGGGGGGESDGMEAGSRCAHED